MNDNMQRNKLIKGSLDLNLKGLFLIIKMLLILYFVKVLPIPYFVLKTNFLFASSSMLSYKFAQNNYIHLNLLFS